MKKFISLIISLSLMLICFAPCASAEVPTATAYASLTAARLANGKATLKWSTAQNASVYRIYRAVGKSTTFSLVAQTAQTRYTDRTAKPNKTYSYKITAHSTANIQTAASDVVKITRANKFSKKLVNSTKLKPLITGHAEIDKTAKTILNKITRPEMTNYQKLKAIYNYCTNSFSYSRTPDYYITSSSYASKLYRNSVAIDTYYLDRAMTAFKTKKGACTAYSGAFVVLCNLAGFSAYIDEGDIHSSNGGYTGHTWTRVKFGGKYYIFDPQVEQNNIGKTASYTYFAQQPSSTRYRKDKQTLKRSIKLRNAALKHFKNGLNAKSVAL